MDWDEYKMDRSFLFTRILQPLTGMFVDAYQEITDKSLYHEVAHADMMNHVNRSRHVQASERRRAK